MRSIKDFFRPFTRPEQPQPNDNANENPETPTNATHNDAEFMTVDGTNLSPKQRIRIEESAEENDDSQGNRTSDLLERSSEPVEHGPIMRPSKIMVRKGETMIRNSDDESDSDMSLDELDALFAKQRPLVKQLPRQQTDVSPKRSTLVSERQSKAGSTSVKGLKKKEHTHPKKVQQVTPKYKFSLESLVKQTESDNAVQAGVTQANSLVAALEQRSQATDAKQRVVVGDIGGLLASVVDKEGEPGKADRLMQAIHRTEAFHQEASWHFISRDSLHQHDEEQEFPSLEMNGIFQKLFRDSLNRTQAFLSGYIGEVAARGKLSNDVLLWTINATCFEPSKHLRDAYILTIVDAADQVTPLLKPSTLTHLFQELGASDEALDIQKTTFPLARYIPTSSLNVALPWSRVSSLLTLLSKTAQYLSTEARIHALCLLCRLSLDADLLSNSGVVVKVEDAFRSLAATTTANGVEQVLSTVLNKTFPRVNDHNLRIRLVNSIPASPQCLSVFRQRLSLAFFFEDALPLIKSPSDLVDLTEIASELDKSRFCISPTANYPRITAMISVLDVAIGDGNPPDSRAGPKAEEVFNQKVDYLADSIKSMFTRIIDTGASHMLRTQTKDALELLRYRLSWAVRTKPKPRHGIFDSHKVDLDGMGLGIQNYFKRIDEIDDASRDEGVVMNTKNVNGG